MSRTTVGKISRSEPVERPLILPGLKTRTFGRTFHWYRKIDSTNRVAFDRAVEGGEEGEIFMAEAQTRGRGRVGKSWFSPPYMNLYLSLILRPKVAPEIVPGISLVAGVSVARVLQKLYPISALIKWPNDVLVNDKKLAGILCQTQAKGKTTEFVILGIGINLNVPHGRMPRFLQQTATSVFMETGNRCDRGEFVESLLASLERGYCLFQGRGLAPFLPFLRHRSWLTGKQIEVNSGTALIRGVARGISSTGSLLIDSGRGPLEELRSGTVQMIRKASHAFGH